MKPEEKEKQLDIIRRQLGLSEAGEELGVKKNIAVDELIDRAKSMDIQVKQL